MTGARVLLATRNADKAREIASILEPVGRLELVRLDTLGIGPDPREDDIEVHQTFHANALAKARYFHDLTGLPTLADDSGIVVDALAGAPGVRSKRFAQAPGLTGLDLDRANNRLLLDELSGVPADRRAARYVCAAALALPDGRALAAIGAVEGAIAGGPRGDGGFGYDPLFRWPPAGRTFGELEPAAKNRVSHRARAFRALAAELATSLGRFTSLEVPSQPPFVDLRPAAYG